MAYRLNERNIGNCTLEAAPKKRTQKLIGKTRTDEQKEKISKSHIGQTPWNKGISHKEESKQKMSNSKKGMVWWNNGSICKMSNESPGPEWRRGMIS